MSDNDIVNMPIVLAGRNYPVLVAQDEVETVKLINEQLTKEFSDLQKLYSNSLIPQDILAMLLMTYAKKLHDEKQNNNFEAVEKKVQSIENILNKTLDK